MIHFFKRFSFGFPQQSETTCGEENHWSTGCPEVVKASTSTSDGSENHQQHLAESPEAPDQREDVETFHHCENEDEDQSHLGDHSNFDGSCYYQNEVRLKLRLSDEQANLVSKNIADDLEVENEKLSHELEEANQRNQNLVSQKNKLHEDYNRAQADKHELEQVLQRRQVEQANELERREKQKQQLDGERSKLDERCKQLKLNNQELNEIIKRREEEQAQEVSWSKKADDTKRELREALNNERKEKSGALRQMQTKQEEIERLKLEFQMKDETNLDNLRSATKELEICRLNLKEKETEINSKQTLIDELQESTKALTTERNCLKEEVKDLKEEFEMKRLNLEDKETEIRNNQKVIGELQNSTKVLTTEQNRLKQEVQDLKAEGRSLENQVADLMRRAEELQVEATAANERRGEAKELEHKICHSEKKYKEKEEECEKLKEKLSEWPWCILTNQLGQLSDKDKRDKKTLKRIQTSMKQNTSDTLVLMTEKEKKELEMLNEAKESLLKNLEEKASEIERLKDEHLSWSAAQEQNAELEDAMKMEINGHRHRITLLENTNAALERDLNQKKMKEGESEQTVATLREEKTELEKTAERLEKDKRELEAEVKTQIVKSKEEVKRWSLEVSNLQTELTAKSTDKESLILRWNESQDKIAKATNEMQKVKDQHEQDKRERDAASNEKIQTMKNHHDQELQANSKYWQRLIENMKQERDGVSETLKLLEERNRELQGQLDTMSGEIKQLRNAIDIGKADKAERDARIKSLLQEKKELAVEKGTEIKRLEEEKKELEDKMDAAKRDMASKQLEYSARTQTLDGQIQGAKTEVETKNSPELQFNPVPNCSRIQEKQLARELEAAKKEKQNLNERLAELKKNCKAESDRLQEALEKSKEECRRINSTAEYEKRLKEEKELEINQLKTDNSTMSTQLAGENTRTSELYRKLEEAEKAAEEWQEEKERIAALLRETAKEKIEVTCKLNSVSDEMLRTIKELEVENVQLRKDNEELKQETATLEKVKSEETLKLEGRILSLEVVNEERENLTADAISVRDEILDSLRHEKENVKALHDSLGNETRERKRCQETIVLLEKEIQLLKRHGTGKWGVDTAPHSACCVRGVREEKCYKAELPSLAGSMDGFPKVVAPFSRLFYRHQKCRPAKALLIASTYRRASLLAKLKTAFLSGEDGAQSDALIVGKAFPLLGCDTDLFEWCRLLPHLGWSNPTSKIRILSDSANENGIPPSFSPEQSHVSQYPSTMDNILQGLEWLTQDIHPGDRVLLLLIGAGALLPIAHTRQPLQQYVVEAVEVTRLCDACYLPCDFMEATSLAAAPEDHCSVRKEDASASGGIMLKAIPIQTIFNYFSRLPSNTQSTIISDCSVGLSTVQAVHVGHICHYGLVPDKFPSSSSPFDSVPSNRDDPIRPMETRHTNNDTKTPSDDHTASNTVTGAALTKRTSNSTTGRKNHWRLIPRYFDVQGILRHYHTLQPVLMRSEFRVASYRLEDCKVPHSHIFSLSGSGQHSVAYERVMDNKDVRGVFSWALQKELKASNFKISTGLLGVKLSKSIRSALSMGGVVDSSDKMVKQQQVHELITLPTNSSEEIPF